MKNWIFLTILFFNFNVFAATPTVTTLAQFQSVKVHFKPLRDGRFIFVVVDNKIYLLNTATQQSLFVTEATRSYFYDSLLAFLTPNEKWIAFPNYSALAKDDVAITVFNVEDLKNNIVKPLYVRPHITGQLINRENILLTDHGFLVYIITAVDGSDQAYAWNAESQINQLVLLDYNPNPEEYESLHFIGTSRLGHDPHGIAGSLVGLKTHNNVSYLYDARLNAFIDQRLVETAYSFNLVLNADTPIYSVVYNNNSHDYLIIDHQAYMVGSHCYPSFGIYKAGDTIIYNSCGRVKLFNTSSKTLLNENKFYKILPFEADSRELFGIPFREKGDPVSVWRIPTASDQKSELMFKIPANPYNSSSIHFYNPQSGDVIFTDHVPTEQDSWHSDDHVYFYNVNTQEKILLTHHLSDHYETHYILLATGHLGIYEIKTENDITTIKLITLVK